MCYLLYLMFPCDFDVMESLESLEELGVSRSLLVVQLFNLGRVHNDLIPMTP